MNILNKLIDNQTLVHLFDTKISSITVYHSQKAPYTSHHSRKGWYITNDETIGFSPEKIYMDNNGFFIDNDLPFYIEDDTDDVYLYPYVEVTYVLPDKRLSSVDIFVNNMDEAYEVYNQIVDSYTKHSKSSLILT